MNLKALLSVVGTIGVGGVASFALLQTGSLGNSDKGNSDPAFTSSAESSNAGDEATIEQRASLPTPSREIRNVNLDNCLVIGTINEEIFKGLEIKREEYTAVECKNTNSKDSEQQLRDNWKGLFPNELFIYDDGLELGTRFNITTDTQEDDYNDYKTTFNGSKFFYYSVSGDWERETKKILDETITEVKVERGITESNQSIYLLISEKEE